jgi:hypothetical protein
MRCSPSSIVRGLVLAIVLSSTASPVAAKEDGYDPSRAGHPLRIVAYVVHPVGVLLDRVIFRPAWYVFGREPLRTLVGREPELYGQELPEPARSMPGETPIPGPEKSDLRESR